METTHNETLQRHRLLFPHIPPKICNKSVTNRKPHPLWDCRKVLGIQRPGKNGWTGIEKLNVQWTWPPVPGMKKCRNWNNRVKTSQRQTKIQNRNRCESSMLHQTTKKETPIKTFTTRGNIIDYPGESSTPTLYLTTTKLNLNSTISKIKYRYMCMDIKYFYLNKHIDRA